MNLEIIREYCLSKKRTTESFPFDEDTLVFKVMGKMFCLASLSEGNSINLKCEPDKAIALREAHDCVQPGWHMNKKMWNTVMLDNSVRKNTIFEWIDHSYEEVIKKLPKKDLLALRSGK